MGSLIYFDDPSLGVQDLVIIDSQFLTNVMSTIITTKTVIRDGLLDHRVRPPPPTRLPYSPLLLPHLASSFAIAVITNDLESP